MEPTSAGSTGAQGFPGRVSRHWQVFNKYAREPQETEPPLIWTMPWDCWVTLEDKDMHCKKSEFIIENFTEEPGSEHHSALNL